MTPETGRRLLISIDSQRLRLVEGGTTLFDFPISTSLNGPGEVMGSGRTPRGEHRIRIKIGEGCPKGAVFVGRRPTGELYSPDLAAACPERDWILTRILWLSGCEHGVNRGGCRDTLRRFIYIHGTPDTEPMGTARSHGCIRMRNDDLLQLFDQVAVGDPVLITNGVRLD